MPPRATAASGSGAAAAPVGRQNPRPENIEQDSWLRKAAKYFALWWVITTASSFLLGPQSPVAGWLGKNAPGPSSGGDPAKEVKVPDQQQQQQQRQAKGPEAAAMWPEAANLTLHVYLSTAPRWDSATKADFVLAEHAFEPVQYGSWDWAQAWETEFDVPQSVQNNGSLYAVSYLTSDASLVSSPEPSKRSVHTGPASVVLLSRYYPQRKIRAVKNLLAGSEDGEDQVAPAEDGDNALQDDLNKADVPIVSYYHPNLTLALINEPRTIVSPQALPPPVAAAYTFTPSRAQRPLFPDKPERWGYTPPIFQHDFWLLREHMNPVNETVARLPLRIDFHPMSITKHQIFASLDHSFKESAAKGNPTGEMDEIKRMLTETSPWLLGTTVIVSLLHMVFEFLAFSSDVSHWRKKSDVVGVSVRTILTNVVVQLIILLYLWDNNENTSWMILGSQGIGIVIEAWKITKAVDIQIVPSRSGLLPYWVEVHDKHVLSEEELKTQEYDKKAFKIVSYGTIPLLVGYTIYSLLYEVHRGWYSFVISTLTSFVYMFGFVQLIPQLIINYHLKSVAHMPVKSLIYKTLTTVVDDFFSFCIKMPTLHRLACFRDDVVFVVLMYQYWIYRVDPKRANEFGQIAEAEEEMDADTKALEGRKEK